MYPPVTLFLKSSYPGLMKKICTGIKRYLNKGRYSISTVIIPGFSGTVKENCGSTGLPQEKLCLLKTEGFAVGALIHGGVFLMGTYADLLQGAVVFAGAVVGTLLHGALDTVVSMTGHLSHLLFKVILPVCPQMLKEIGKFVPLIEIIGEM